MFDQNSMVLGLFMALKTRLVPSYSEAKPINSQITSNDFQEVMMNIRKFDSYLVAREIHSEICMDVSEKVIREVRAYKWIESEKAGRNLWENHKGEQSQLIAAGKQWVKCYWSSFKATNDCGCA